MGGTITTEELKSKIDEGGDFHLIDVLAPESFEAMHIPKSINIPVGSDFIEEVETASIFKDTEVIVYCSSNTCQASVNAADILEQAGYTNVVHYADGLAGWKDAGYEFEGEAEAVQ
jgi:rhodanese-related sulfurtransferase